jgi:hypothetical protein
MKKPKDIVALAIKFVKGFVTNVDWADLRENFALRTRGFRYDLEGTVGVRDYGTILRHSAYPALPSTISLDGGASIVVEGTEYDVVAGRDTSNYLHLYAYDGSWTELTQRYNAWIKSVSGAVVTIAANSAGSLQGVKDSLNTTRYNAVNEFNGWVVHNVTAGKYSWISASAASVASTTFATITVSRDVTGTTYDTWAAADVLVLYRHSIIKTAWNEDVGATPFVSWLPIAEQSRLNFYYETTAAVKRQPVSITKLSSARTYFSGLTVGGSPTPTASPTFTGWALAAGGGGLCTDYDTVGGAAAGIAEDFTNAGGGTNIITAASTTITGTGTSFGSLLQVGCYIKVQYADTSTEVLRVTDIASNTSLTVSAQPTKAETITSWWYSGQAYTGVGASVEDGNGYAWLRIRSHRVDIAGSESPTPLAHYVRYYVCAVYDGYQISDPIAKIYTAGSSGYWPKVSMSFEVCYELMPKNITALRVYADETDDTTNPIQTEWIDATTNYKFVQEISVTGTAATNQGVWRLMPNPVTTDRRYHVTTSTEFTQSYIENARSGGAPLSTDLAHAIDITRAYITPRYAVRNRRVLNALVVTDRDDDTLAICNVNGSGVAEQDNFPDLTTDTVNNKLSIYMVTQGKLYGLAMLDDIVYAFKRTAVEKFDAQSGQQWTIEADFLARRSIVVAEDAIYWAGESAIWRLRRGSNTPEIINKQWQNFYNGNLGRTESTGLESVTTPYMTSAYRTAIIGGYDPKYREVWFQSQVNKDSTGTEYLCFRFQIHEDIWNVRELNVTGSVVKWFDLTQSRTMDIGISSGILKYPNLESAFRYTDEVGYTAAAAGNGVPTKQTIHCGSLYSIDTDFVLDSVEVDHEGSTTADYAVYYDLQFIANKELSAYSSKTLQIDTKTLPVGLPHRGPLSRLRIYIGLPTATLSTFNSFAVNTIVANVVRRLKVGNK